MDLNVKPIPEEIQNESEPTPHAGIRSPKALKVLRETLIQIHDKVLTGRGTRTWMDSFILKHSMAKL